MNKGYAAGAALMVLCRAQSSAPKTFEVASIKRCPSNERQGTNGGETRRDGTLLKHCATLRELIQSSYILFADGTRHGGYGLTAIEGAPAWIDSERYEIAAKAEGSPDSYIMEGPMMQGLLAERCKIKVHRETKDAPVYILTVAKSGLKVPTAKQNCWTPGKDPRPEHSAGKPMFHICGQPHFIQNGFDLIGDTITDFSYVLSLTPKYRLDRHVIDRTGIAGNFDFHLEWPPESPPSDPGGAAPRIDPFSAFQPGLQKLGLKLTPGKGPVETLIVDHIERPSAN
jgi:uncharacterized protein (TIGR03435 family)